MTEPDRISQPRAAGVVAAVDRTTAGLARKGTVTDP
jgi:hypothetical protein